MDAAGAFANPRSPIRYLLSAYRATSLFPTALSPLGDSMRNVGESRAFTVDAVLAVFCALVLLPVHGLLLLADRTSLRMMLKPARATGLERARRSAVQPKPTWTITRMPRTFLSRVAVVVHRRRPAQHPLDFRHSPPVESPGAGRVSDNDETRNSDQREPARNAGRYHRGRPAR